jgi:rsbT co-antagonist protein RsbR
MRDAINQLDDLFYLFSPEGEFIEWNDALREVTGYADEDIDSMHLRELFSGDDEEAIDDTIDRVVTDRRRYTVEVNLETSDGTAIPYEFSASPLSDAGDVDAIVGVARDISAQQETEQKIRELTREIRELSMPVVEIWEGVTLTTVVGSLDTEQAERLTEDLLDEIVDQESSVALIDITGVTAIDTATARHLIDTINAVNLLGADVIITGIKPDIAQTLVQLGVPLSDIETRASLMEGLRTALAWQGVEMD